MPKREPPRPHPAETPETAAGHAAREERLALALRENLRRRKSQLRARTETQEGRDAAVPPGKEPDPGPA